jgi:hypothetical protein
MAGPVRVLFPSCEWLVGSWVNFVLFFPGMSLAVEPDHRCSFGTDGRLRVRAFAQWCLSGQFEADEIMIPRLSLIGGLHLVDWSLADTERSA